MESCGENHEGLARYMRSFGSGLISVELTEVYQDGEKTFRVSKESRTEISQLKTKIMQKVVLASDLSP